MYLRTGNPKGLTESGSGELGIIVCGRVDRLEELGIESGSLGTTCASDYSTIPLLVTFPG